MTNKIFKTFVCFLVFLSFPIADAFSGETTEEAALTKREIILTGRKNKIEMAAPKVSVGGGLVTISFEDISASENVGIYIIDEKGEVVFDGTVSITNVCEINIFVDLDSSKEYTVEIYSKNMDLYGDI
jgi:hypothetical protein